ncbi:hypothetical protein HY489_00185 [Candidatus Woesearchaeota archaeon]|nr:hypothetical protein [Candidatus Woesearchaeota archaeon]
MDLKEWTKTLLKSRDSIKQEIIKIEDQNGELTVHKKTGQSKFIIKPELKDLNSIPTSQVNLVILNTKKNLEFVITNWQTLAQHKNLCIYFVNPTTNDKWLLYPYTHNQITEKIALRKGLETMFAEVPTVV